MHFLKKIIVCIVFPVSLFAQSQSMVPDDMISSMFNYLYNFSFHKADSVLIKINATYPESLIKDFLNVNYNWYLIISGEDNDKVYSNFKMFINHAFTKINTTPIESLTNELLFETILIYSYNARIEIFQNNNINAAVNLQNAMRYLKLSFQKENEFEKFKLTSGLYNYSLTYALEKYPIIYPFAIFLPKSDKQMGLKLLNLCLLSDNNMIRTEACYFLMKIYIEAENNLPSSEVYIRTLTEKYPKNLIYHYYHYILIANYDPRQADEYLTKCSKIAEDNDELTLMQKTHLIKIMKTYKINHQNQY